MRRILLVLMMAAMVAAYALPAPAQNLEFSPGQEHHTVQTVQSGSTDTTTWDTTPWSWDYWW